MIIDAANVRGAAVSRVAGFAITPRDDNDDNDNDIGNVSRARVRYYRAPK